MLYHSEVYSADDPASANFKVEPLAVPKVVKSLTDDINDSGFKELSIIDEDSHILSPISQEHKPMPIIDPSDLVGRSFLRTEEDR